MSNIQNKVITDLKFVYSDNNSISIIFPDNDLLMGVVGEFNKNLKDLENLTDTNLYFRGNSIIIKSDNKLFAGNIDFIKGIKSINEMPIGDFIEICFSGRSNVGKSSLINYLTGRRSIARTSKTSGRTREINFFRINNNRQLVDLPGYGYAQVSKKERQAWFKMVKDYFFHSNNLRRVFLLIDSRHGIKPSDIDLMKILEEANNDKNSIILYTIVDSNLGKFLAASSLIPPSGIACKI